MPYYKEYSTAIRILIIIKSIQTLAIPKLKLFLPLLVKFKVSIY